MIVMPEPIPCPKCGKPMAPEMASGGWAPEGFEPEYDHWWCKDCAEVVFFDEVDPEKKNDDLA